MPFTTATNIPQTGDAVLANSGAGVYFAGRVVQQTPSLSQTWRYAVKYAHQAGAIETGLPLTHVLKLSSPLESTVLTVGASVLANSHAQGKYYRGTIVAHHHSHSHPSHQYDVRFDEHGNAVETGIPAEYIQLIPERMLPKKTFAFMMQPAATAPPKPAHKHHCKQPAAHTPAAKGNPTAKGWRCGWACGACTLHNKPSTTNCVVCHTPKGAFHTPKGTKQQKPKQQKTKSKVGFKSTVHVHELGYPGPVTVRGQYPGAFAKIIASYSAPLAAS